MSWCQFWSNSLWQGWSCGLVHCLAGNATDPIWRVLASSLGISSWTLLKPHHSNTNTNPNRLANQLWCIDFLTPPTQTPCLPWISYATQKLILDSCKMAENQSEGFHTFLLHIFHVLNRVLLHTVLLKCPHVQIAFLKFTSCDNPALVGCIPIAVVAVHLDLKL